MSQLRETMAEALRPLRARLGITVKEHEVLRVVATLEGRDAALSADTARREILAWAQNRAGARLPPSAWAMEDFEHYAGGRNSIGTRISSTDSDVWAIRTDDPDKLVAGRTWTSEVVVGHRQGFGSQFSLRLLVSSAESDLAIEPHTPGLVQQINDRCGISLSNFEFDTKPWIVDRDDEAHTLVDHLVSEARPFPYFVISSTDEGEGLSGAEAEALSRAVLGLARVVVIAPQQSWVLTDRLAKLGSVYGGAVRAYLPGFNANSNPYDHRLFLPEQIESAEGKERSLRWLKTLAASESVRRNRLGREVLGFSTVRSAALRARQERLVDEGASDSEQLKAAIDRISALERDLEDERAALVYFDEAAAEAEERAEVAEAQLRAASYRIQSLEKLAAVDEVARQRVDTADPTAWPEFAQWCDANFAGRVTLAPAARRGVRSPDFDDVGLAARCINWLATTYRDGRLLGAEGGFRDVYIEGGIKNSPCGGDEFDFDWQGRRHTADWHVKNGGNTRDPTRCLRIYYFWDSETAQVVVADMPAHRHTAIT